MDQRVSLSFLSLPFRLGPSWWLYQVWIGIGKKPHRLHYEVHGELHIELLILHGGPIRCG